MSLPEGFTPRSARDGDAERAAELVNEETRVHLGTPIWSTEQVLRLWSNPVVDRERDVAVVETPDGEIAPGSRSSAARRMSRSSRSGSSGSPGTGSVWAPGSSKTPSGGRAGFSSSPRPARVS